MGKSYLYRWLSFYSISIFVAVLSSCNPNTTPVSPIRSTSTVAATPSLTLAPSQTSTATPVPSSTLPPATLSVVSTMDAIVALKPELQEYYHYYQECVFMPHACVSPGLGLSPNGAWAVFFNGSDIRIISVNDTKEWQVTFSELSGTEGAGTVSVVHWSLDGKYVYVVPRQDGADGGYESFWGWKGTKLIRLDLETGSWTDTKMGYAYSFSPNDHYLVYRSEQGIHIHDLTTGQEKIIPISYAEYGRFTWSPDSQQIIFIATQNETDLENRENGFIALLYDVGTDERQIEFENNLKFLYPVQWNDENQVVFEKLFDGFGERYILDINRGIWTITQSP